MRPHMRPPLLSLIPTAADQWETKAKMATNMRCENCGSCNFVSSHEMMVVCLHMNRHYPGEVMKPLKYFPIKNIHGIDFEQCKVRRGMGDNKPKP